MLSAVKRDREIRMKGRESDMSRASVAPTIPAPSSTTSCFQLYQTPRPIAPSLAALPH